MRIFWWICVLLFWPAFLIVFITDPRLDPDVVGENRIDHSGVALLAVLFGVWLVLASVTAALIVIFGATWYEVAAIAAAHACFGLLFRSITTRPDFLKMMGYRHP